MKHIKVVIGSNYGDECKGLATNYFSSNSDGKCLNVLFNGGSQRGHTVDLKNGWRHVFHHFGSGTFSGATTYFDKNFMVYPAEFVREYITLPVRPRCFASKDCRVTTPYDAFINWIVEDSRGDSRHGSCGYGVWETQKRYEDGNYSFRLSKLFSMRDEEIFEYLTDIANVYLPNRLKYYGIYRIPDEYKVLISSERLRHHFLQDIREMQSVVEIADFQHIAEAFDTIVFEGAQGLALDENNKKSYPHVTASDTTSQNPLKLIKELQCSCDIEVCYITRSYFTRHGAGEFPTECDKDKINPLIEDATNIDNKYQKSIRYGYFDKKEFMSRVNSDRSLAYSLCGEDFPIKFSVFVSHLNYTDGEIFGNCKIKDLFTEFSCIYKSSTKYAEDIECLTL
jgi:adenylosuccinate synthase